MNSKEQNKDLKASSRRRFLKGGAALAGLAAVGGIRSAQAQQAFGLPAGERQVGWVPEGSIPPQNILKDPWTGEPLRDPEGNPVVDWTGSPQWEKYRQGARTLGGPLYGTRERDFRLYGYRSRYVTSTRIGTNGANAPQPTNIKTPFFSLLSPLHDQMGVITPTSLSFMDEHGYEIPDIDPRTHTVTIQGMVDHPMTFTMEDLMRLPSVSRIHTVECNSNGTVNHENRLQPWATPGDIYGELSCNEYTGVLLSTLFQMCGVQRGASWIWAGAKDSTNHTKSIPLSLVMDDAMVAYGQNGEALRPEQGFPVRLLVPGTEGVTNIKRLARIKLTNEPGPFLREARIYTTIRGDGKIRWFQLRQPPKSVILRPGPTHPVPSRGYYEIRGIAWSGQGKVRRVEITTDGGKTWKDAQLQEPVHSKAIARFVLPWTWNGEEVTLASRCTDEKGATQPTIAEFAKHWGTTPEWFKTPRSSVWRFNVIQPWKVATGGKVTNAIFSI